MEAHNLLPDYFCLADVTGEEPEQAGRIFCFSPGSVNVGNASIGGGACSTLLGAVLSYGSGQLPIDTPIEITRYAVRPASQYRPGALDIEVSEGETFTLPQIFGSVPNAQAVVEEAWRTIHLGTAAAVLSRPTT